MTAKREDFEAWTRKFYADLACAGDTWSDEKGTYTDFAHHMAWCLWRDLVEKTELDLLIDESTQD